MSLPFSDDFDYGNNRSDNIDWDQKFEIPIPPFTSGQSTQQIKEFHLITNLDSSTFETLVNEYLQNGWELHGDIFFTDKIYLSQAMVKCES